MNHILVLNKCVIFMFISGYPLLICVVMSVTLGIMLNYISTYYFNFDAES